MKKLPPITYEQWQCDFCKRKYKRKSACLSHENECYKNPERNCEICGNTGQLTDHIDFGRTGEVDCWACKHASELGGKSFIDRDINVLTKK